MVPPILQVHVRGNVIPILSGEVNTFVKLSIAIRSKCPASHSDVFMFKYSAGSFQNCDLKCEEDFNTMLAVGALFSPPVVTIQAVTMHDLFGTLDTTVPDEDSNIRGSHAGLPDIPQYSKPEYVDLPLRTSSNPKPLVSRASGKKTISTPHSSNIKPQQPANHEQLGLKTSMKTYIKTGRPKQPTNQPYKCLQNLSLQPLASSQLQSGSVSSWANTEDSIVDGEYVTRVSEPLYATRSQIRCVEFEEDDTGTTEQPLDVIAERMLARQEKLEQRRASHRCSKKARLEKNRRGEWFPGIHDSKPAFDYPRINEDKPLMSDPWLASIKGVGQQFAGGVVQFRNELRKYASKLGFHYSFSRNDSRYVHVFCKLRDEDGCKWFVHGALERVTNSVFIKSADLDHTCSLSVLRNDNSRMSAALIGDIIQDKIRGDPELTCAAMKKELLDFYGFDLPYMKVWRGMEVAKAGIFGSYQYSFNELKWYSKAIISTNPGSIVALETELVTNKFQRFFCAFHGSLQAFKSCRPMLFIDGTFMNNRYKGTVLAATAKDGNQGLLPVAFAIVESENSRNWAWFINLVREHVTHEDEILFISDRAGGILAAFDTMHQRPNHFFCLWHLMKNLREKYPTKSYSDFFRNTMCKLLREVAYAPTIRTFDKALKRFHDLGQDIGRRWISELPFDRWCLAFAPNLLRYGEMTSNAAESFNGALVIARGLPCTFMVDLIRAQLMKWFVERREAAKKHKGALTETMEDRWNKYSGLQSSWKIITAKQNTEFEVLSRPSTMVNIQNRTCTCWDWQIEGFPCPHAIAVINRHKLDIRDIIDPYYFSDTYSRVYNSDINPIPTTAKYEFIDEDSTDLIQPPNLKKVPGRPKATRYRNPREPRQQPSICPRCGELGRHSWAICAMALHPETG